MSSSYHRAFAAAPCQADTLKAAHQHGKIYEFPVMLIIDALIVMGTAMMIRRFRIVLTGFGVMMALSGRKIFLVVFTH